MGLPFSKRTQLQTFLINLSRALMGVWSNLGDVPSRHDLNHIIPPSDNGIPPCGDPLGYLHLICEVSLD